MLVFIYHSNCRQPRQAYRTHILFIWY